ncbi:MAG TPA: lectin [Streptosporangiaceae bacterium]
MPEGFLVMVLGTECDRLRANGNHWRAAATAVLMAGAALMPASAAAAAATAAAAPRQVMDPASLVNPFIGTSNNGDTFPGADAPFGMVQWSPDTTPDRPRGGGYYYRDSSITGFSLSHLSGPGCFGEGDVPVLPTTGTPSITAAEGFSHASESASAGAYRVRLNNGVTTALTATTRTGMAQFTFPSTTQANLILKLDDSQNGDTSASFRALSPTEAQGSVTSGDFCRTRNSYTLYFDMRFSRPFTTSGTFTAGVLHQGARHLTVKAHGSARPTTTVPPNVAERPDHPVYHGPLPPGRTAVTPAITGPAGAYLTFSTKRNTTLLAKVGLSYVSTGGARANLAAENPGWDFGSTRAATQRAWNHLLGEIRVTGGTGGQRTEFYTALYHALLSPNVFSDDNGRYLGADGKLHTVGRGHSAFYTNFSGWDIYRTQAQLEAVLDPRVAGDTAQSMVDDYGQHGMLPKWMQNNGETYMMAGDPADSILADYYAFGARNFSTSAALNDMVAEARKTSNIRPGLRYLTAPGYLPINGSYGCCNYYGPAATTLEYDTADFAISAMAGALGKTSVQQTFLNRSQDWRNVLNPDSGFDQPRNPDGSWYGGFSPAGSTGFVEADSWVYTGMVPFNLAGLAAAKGGDAAMAAYLNTTLRSFTGADGYAWMGNEPSIELPWEYDYIGQPWRAQNTIAQIQSKLWSNTPWGLAGGNDDLGAMSSWFVWSALGMYPMTPGTANLALSSPMFSQAVIRPPSGNALTIDTTGTGRYVRSATWNGTAWAAAHAPPGAITSGGRLSYTLGTSASTSWGSAPGEAPPSYSGSTVRPPQPRTGPIDAGVKAGLCIDDRESSVSDGNPIQTYGCNGSDTQEWTIAPDGTIRVLGKCLDVRHSGTSNGTLTDLYQCNGTGAQQWTRGASGSLVNPESKLCLDDPRSATKPGTQLQIYACNRTNAQNWTLPRAPGAPVGAIVSRVSSRLCVDDRQGGTTNGNPVQIWTCNKSKPQNWTIEPDSTLRVLGACMDAVNGGTTAGTHIGLARCNGTGAQQWRIKTSGAVVNPQSGLCLNDPRSATRPGTQLELYSCNGTDAQAWRPPAAGSPTTRGRTASQSPRSARR